MSSAAGQTQNRVGRAQFAQWVRSALRQLYDAPLLKSHPLAEVFAGASADGIDAAQALRRHLLEAIQSQRPTASTPANSPDWRAYRILELRYLEGLGSGEAMEALALQKSQFFRDQARAIARLTDTLWESVPKQRSRSLGAAASPSERYPESLLGAEMDRLAAGAAREQVNLAEVLLDLDPVWKPLAQARNVQLSVSIDTPVVVHSSSRVMLRQAILNLLTCAMDHSADAPLQVSTFSAGSQAGVLVRTLAPIGATVSAAGGSAFEDRLDVCRRLMESMRGVLQVRSAPGEPWEARLSWPTDQGSCLLVIDDNQGFEELFRRFLSGHGWQVVGAASWAQARELIARARPTAITVDVLMPQEDGWELLMALKSNPETRAIPVIVCSVLYEPQLALSLGAAAYLPKPVSESSLLSVLSPWTEASASSAPGRSG